MEEYIPKSALVVEIERRFKEHDSKKHDYASTDHFWRAIEDKDILSFINTLEVKEVNLKEERIKECPFKNVGCEMYEGHILECKGECSWVVDHPKLKELKAEKENDITKE